MISPTNGDDPTGPSDSTLRSLRGMMPKLAEGIKSNKIGGKGKPASVQVMRDRKVCLVCMGTHDKGLASPGIELVPEMCPKCDKMLKAGYTALTCDKRCYFIKSSKLSDFAGKILPIDSAVMDAIEKAAKESKGQVNGHKHKIE